MKEVQKKVKAYFLIVNLVFAVVAFSWVVGALEYGSYPMYAWSTADVRPGAMEGKYLRGLTILESEAGTFSGGVLHGEQIYDFNHENKGLIVA